MSDIEMEFSRLSAVEIKGDFKATKSSIKGVTNGLKRLGILNDEQAQTLQKIQGALSVITGTLSLVMALRGIQEAKTVMGEVKSAALTAMNSTNPIGWGKIALATGVTAATSIALYTAVNNIKLGSFNLGTAEGRDSATQAVMEVI